MPTPIVRQDMPPIGGFPKYVQPSFAGARKGFGPYTIFLGFFATVGYGLYSVQKYHAERRESAIYRSKQAVSRTQLLHMLYSKNFKTHYDPRDHLYKGKDTRIQDFLAAVDLDRKERIVEGYRAMVALPEVAPYRLCNTKEEDTYCIGYDELTTKI